MFNNYIIFYYFLIKYFYFRLKLPGEIEENDSSFGSYDCEKGDFTLKFTKVIKGEYFENLDMISTLLAPPKKKGTIVPNIEVIGNPSANSEDINDISNEPDFISNDENTNGDEWYMHQNNVQTVSLLPTSPKYGFANKISGALAAFEVFLIIRIKCVYIYIYIFIFLILVSMD